jgi:hypothetical protein
MTDENQFKRVEWTDDGYLPSDDDGPDGMPLMPPRGPGLSDADLELLTLAARALGATVETVEGEQWVALRFADGKIEHGWNPLRHSDDALALAVRLRISITIDSLDICTSWAGIGMPPMADGIADMYEEVGDDALAATRRAITRAAAEIGKSM